MKGFAKIFKGGWEDVPRDEKGRWTAVSFGKGSFGVERTVQTRTATGRTTSRSLGRGPDLYQSMDVAHSVAAALNRALDAQNRVNETRDQIRALEARQAEVRANIEQTKERIANIRTALGMRKADMSSADLDTAGKKNPEQGCPPGKKKYRKVQM